MPTPPHGNSSYDNDDDAAFNTSSSADLGGFATRPPVGRSGSASDREAEFFASQKAAALEKKKAKTAGMTLEEKEKFEREERERKEQRERQIGHMARLGKATGAGRVGGRMGGRGGRGRGGFRG